jgi:hypothetical protein
VRPCAKCRCTIFYLGWDLYGYDKKCAGRCYAVLVFLHPVGSTGHVVHSGVFEARNVKALFFMLWWDWYGFDKKCTRTHYIEIVFLHLVGSTGHVVHSGKSGARNVGYFSFSGGLEVVSLKSTSGHVMPNLCFCISWELRVTKCVPVLLLHET